MSMCKTCGAPITYSCTCGLVDEGDVEKLRAQLAEAEAQRDGLRGSHAEMVKLKYKLEAAEARLARLRPVVREVVEAMDALDPTDDAAAARRIADVAATMTVSDRAWALGSEQEGQNG